MYCEQLNSLAMSYVNEYAARDVSEENKEEAYQTLLELLRQNISYDYAIDRCKQLIASVEPAEKIITIFKTSEKPIPNPIRKSEKSVKNRRRKSHSWSNYEDQRLVAGIYRYGINSWGNVADFVGNGRTKAQCSQRWYRGIDPSICKGPWTVDEENLLIDLLHQYGYKSWKTIAQFMDHRSDVQCRYHFAQMQKGKFSDIHTPKKEIKQAPVFIPPQTKSINCGEVNPCLKNCFTINVDKVNFNLIPPFNKPNTLQNNNLSQLRTNYASAYEHLPELSQLPLANSKFFNHFSPIKGSSTKIMNQSSIPVIPPFNFPVHNHHKPVDEPSVDHIESDTSRVTQPNDQNSDDIIEYSNYNKFKNGQHGHLLNLHGDQHTPSQHETDVDKIFYNFDFSLGWCGFNDECCDFGISNTNNNDLLEHN